MEETKQEMIDQTTESPGRRKKGYRRAGLVMQGEYGNGRATPPHGSDHREQRTTTTEFDQDGAESRDS
jgi:hypothetical protein